MDFLRLGQGIGGRNINSLDTFQWNRIICIFCLFQFPLKSKQNLHPRQTSIISDPVPRESRYQLSVCHALQPRVPLDGCCGGWCSGSSEFRNRVAPFGDAIGESHFESSSASPQHNSPRKSFIPQWTVEYVTTKYRVAELPGTA